MLERFFLISIKAFLYFSIRGALARLGRFLAGVLTRALTFSSLALQYNMMIQSRAPII